MKYQYDELESVAEKVGSPFYILSTARFKENLASFLTEFKKRYKKTKVAYSYKTNYIPRLCALANDMGMLAEVVSEMEYAIAERVGVDPRNIVYNGPVKPGRHLETALLKGSMVNLDSFFELDLLLEICRRHEDRSFAVGLRANFNHADDAPRSRFGFNVENGDFARATLEVARMGNAWVKGLHCHFRVPGRTPKGYNGITRAMLKLAAEHFENGQLEYIDVGGGFFSRMPESFARQFETPIPTYGDYADAVATELFAAFGDGDDGPLLILEPGTAVAADIMSFATRVIDIKRLPGRNLAMTDGSVYNIKPTLNKMNLPMTVVAPADSKEEDTYDVVGYTCKEDDVLFPGLSGAVSRGDYLVFDNVGAYTVVLSPPFIRPAPPIVEMEDGRFSLVRRAQTVEDALAGFID